MLETLLVNSIDIKSVVPNIQVIDGMYPVPATRGENVLYTGTTAEQYVPKPVSTGVIALGMTFTGDDLDQRSLNDRARDLRQLVPPNHVFAMTRRMSYPGGYEDHYANGSYLSGLELSIQALVAAKLTLALRVLSGLWYGNPVIAAVPGTVVGAGECDTHRIVVHMRAGTLTNTTTGHTLTYNGPDVATISVESFSARVGRRDRSNRITWNKDYPMVIVPGTNVFTCTSTASISYQPAYY